MAKGEIAHYEQFQLRPQCFQKPSAAIAFAIALKCVCKWERDGVIFTLSIIHSFADESKHFHESVTVNF